MNKSSGKYDSQIIMNESLIGNDLDTKERKITVCLKNGVTKSAKSMKY